MFFGNSNNNNISYTSSYVFNVPFVYVGKMLRLGHDGLRGRKLILGLELQRVLLRQVLQPHDVRDGHIRDEHGVHGVQRLW